MSTSSGVSGDGWPVATARSQPWTSTSRNRWPAYTEPGTGPYDTAHGASSAPGAVEDPGRGDGRLVVLAERRRLEHVTVVACAHLLDRRAGGEVRCPPVPGDDVVEQRPHVPVVARRRACHWSSRMPATTSRVASSAARWAPRCRARDPTSRRHPFTYESFSATQPVADPHDVDAADVPAGPRVAPPLDDPVAGGEGLLRLEAARGVGEDRAPTRRGSRPGPRRGRRRARVRWRRTRSRR